MLRRNDFHNARSSSVLRNVLKTSASTTTIPVARLYSFATSSSEYPRILIIEIASLFLFTISCARR